MPAITFIFEYRIDIIDYDDVFVLRVGRASVWDSETVPGATLYLVEQVLLLLRLREHAPVRRPRGAGVTLERRHHKRSGKCRAVAASAFLPKPHSLQLSVNLRKYTHLLDQDISEPAKMSVIKQ